MDQKKQPQKYSSLLPPAEETENRPRKSSMASQTKSSQRYDSLLPPVGAPSGSGSSRRHDSLLEPEDDLIAPPVAPPPIALTQHTPSVHDEPPAYADDAADNANDLMPPDTLLLAGTEIHSTRSADSLALYKLSLAIGHLRQSNMTVSFSRLDYRVRNGSSSLGAGAPSVTARERHIYNLTRLPDIMLPKYQYHLEALTRSTLSHVGLKPHRGLGSTGWRSWKLTRPNKATDYVQGDGLFDVKNRRQGHSEWRDSSDKNRILAYETSEQGMYRLQVVQTLDRKTLDALVATWCLKLWWEIAVANVPPLTWEEVKRILQTRTNEFPVGTGAGY